MFDNRIVDFTRGFGQSTDLQKKIINILQSSEIVQQKQKYLVIILFELYYIVCNVYNILKLICLENVMD